MSMHFARWFIVFSLAIVAVCCPFTWPFWTTKMLCVYTLPFWPSRRQYRKPSCAEWKKKIAPYLAKRLNCHRLSSFGLKTRANAISAIGMQRRAPSKICFRHYLLRCLLWAPTSFPWVQLIQLATQSKSLSAATEPQCRPRVPLFLLNGFLRSVLRNVRCRMRIC